MLSHPIANLLICKVNRTAPLNGSHLLVLNVLFRCQPTKYRLVHNTNICVKLTFTWLSNLLSFTVPCHGYAQKGCSASALKHEVWILGQKIKAIIWAYTLIIAQESDLCSFWPLNNWQFSWTESIDSFHWSKFTLLPYNLFAFWCHTNHSKWSVCHINVSKLK